MMLTCRILLGADWVEQGDILDGQFKSAEALAAYKKGLVEEPDNPDLLRKISKQYVEMVPNADSKKEKLRLAELGYETAVQAKKLAPDDPQVRLTVSIAAGRLAFFSDPGRRLELSREVESESAKAMELDPNLALAWHVQGRWNYEIANLNPFLRILARTIYGYAPTGTNEEAIRCLLKAVELEPNNPLFRVELGRAYLAGGQKKEAKRELEKSLSLPDKTPDDAEAKDRARQALGNI
jgi:tetratricopeptide (TPR) repeat protein